MLVAGDAAALCLAAGIWLEGVNFAMASGMYAGEAAVGGASTAATSARPGCAGYQRRLSDTFVLSDHRKLRRAPELVLSDRVQHLYPTMVANVVERMFRVDNPDPKPGLRRILAAGTQAGRRAPTRPGARRLDRLQELRMTDTHHLRSRSGWSTAEFRVHPDAHIVVDGSGLRGLQHTRVRGRVPGQPVRAHQRRRHRVQLRAVLRMRHVLPRVQPRGRDQLELPRGRPRRRLPPDVSRR